MYKLKKWYPSLPKDWEVGMEVGQGDRLNGMYYSPCSSTFKDTMVFFKEVEENEEFWEKVVPKEFKVLKRNLNPLQGATGKAFYTIESVERLSDGEVFSLGDSVTSDFKEDGVQIIQSLDIKGDYISVRLGKKKNSNFVAYRKLDMLHTYKEPTIKTTDGLELIAGDRYYVPQVEGKLRRLTGSEIMFYVEPDMPEDETKRFAKKENAQAYIENNIELFSAKDIHELLKKHSRLMVDSSVYLELSEMVKERYK